MVIGLMVEFRVEVFFIFCLRGFGGFRVVGGGDVEAGYLEGV